MVLLALYSVGAAQRSPSGLLLLHSVLASCFFMHGLVTFMKGAVFTSQGLLFGTSVKLCDSAFAITAVASSPAPCRTSMRHLQLASATGWHGLPKGASDRLALTCSGLRECLLAACCTVIDLTCD